MPPPRPEPAVILGPILFFRGEQGSRWRLSALFVLEGDTEPHDLGADGVTLAIPPRHVARWRNRHVWRFDFAVPRGAVETTVGYGFGADRRWRLTVPGRGQRLGVAYTSCNGAEDEDTLERHPAPRNALWVDLLRRHRETRFHLLLQGGDQLYADAVWKECPDLLAWAERPAAIRFAEPCSSEMAEQATDFYFEHYLKTWAQPEVAEALSAIPTMMMWDDHDVFDGFGSHEEPAHSAPVPHGVALAARRAFATFQVGATTESLPECVWGAGIGTFTTGLRIDEVGIFAPDLRSERTPRRVLSERSWAELPRWLDRFAGCRHLFILSSVPLLYPDIGGIERFVARLPFRIGYEDDLRDQWRSHAHAFEWRRMLAMLSGYARRNDCRITILSGEVHAGGRARLTSGGVEIWQLIASGIVHPPPPRLYTAALERLAARVEAPADGAVLEMVPFPESGRRIIRQRNWLALDIDDDRVAATWHAEGAPDTYRQTIGP